MYYTVSLFGLHRTSPFLPFKPYWTVDILIAKTVDNTESYTVFYCGIVWTVLKTAEDTSTPSDPIELCYILYYTRFDRFNQLISTESILE